MVGARAKTALRGVRARAPLQSAERVLSFHTCLQSSQLDPGPSPPHSISLCSGGQLGTRQVPL